MTIKELKKILKDAHDNNKNVYIDNGKKTYDFTGYSWDDNCELQLYVNANDKEA